MIKSARRTFLLLLLVGLSNPVIAGALESYEIRLSIPSGFIGPFTKQLDANGTTSAYYRRLSDGGRGTLLQVTSYDFGSKMPVVPKSDLAMAAEKYLLDFLGGVKRLRQSFVAEPVQRITLGGIPAAKIYWSGAAQGLDLHGVMYAVIVGSKVVSFHAQDSLDAPKVHIDKAIQAVESVRFMAMK